uniref:Protein kinase domain-containing protein n=1 Tax=Aegilops tauschii subsp. strangulata TaxID=200361 RepID=A0A453A452_AEGTS
DRIIGRGGFGKVYKGELDSGELIAVKMLHPLQGLDEDLFKNEVCNNLLKVDHPNVIGLLGYCDELHSEFVEHKGDNIAAKHVYRGLCFEYFPNGSLHKHLSGTMERNFSTVFFLIINFSYL